MENLQKIIQRVDKLREYSVDTKHKRADIVTEISKCVSWLTGNRSIQEHGLCFAFLQYLHSVGGRHIDDFDLFYDEIKIAVKHCHIRTTEATIDGQRVIFRKYLTKSLSFGRCTQEVFHSVFERIKEYALSKYQVNFSEWEREYLTGASK